MSVAASAPPDKGRGGSSGVSPKAAGSLANTLSSFNFGTVPDSLPEPLLTSILSHPSNLLVQPLVTLTMYIPTSCVGGIIGRRGQNIAQLQKVASTPSAPPVRVSIVSPSDPAETIPFTHSPLDWTTSPEWTPVVVRADLGGTLQAAHILAANVPLLDHIVLDVPLSRHKHAAIVGKRGLVLAQLSANHQVRIMVPNKEVRQDIIQLEGDIGPVTHCLADLLSIAHNKEDTTRAAVPSNLNTTTRLTLATLPTQAQWKQWTRKTDCQLHQKKKVGDVWEITVAGPSMEHVATAVQMLQNPQDGNEETPSPRRQNNRWNKKKGATKRPSSNNNNNRASNKNTADGNGSSNSRG
jgi:KH domain